MYSIFIPTFNAENFIGPLLDVIEELPLDDYELCIVDSSSTDATTTILASRNISYHTIDSSDFDHAGTRSLAKSLCHGDIVVYLTQDARPVSSQDIVNLVSAFNDASVGAAYGRQLPHHDANVFGSHLRYFNYTSESYVRCYSDRSKYGIKTAFLSNSFSAYRRDAMDDIGWFADGLILGEDTYAGAKLLKAGYKLAYVAEARVYHSHNYTVVEEFKRYFDIGVFHAIEDWVLKEFGRPEGEGMRYIKSEFIYLLEKKMIHLLPVFLVRNISKYLGYKLGNKYARIPVWLVQKLSMHSGWWSANK